MSGNSVWIDATRLASGTSLWGMTLVERQIRQFSLLGMKNFRVFFTEETRQKSCKIRDDFYRVYSSQIEWTALKTSRQFWSSLLETEDPVILVAGDVVYDDRVFNYLIDEGPGSVVSSQMYSACHLSAKHSEQFVSSGISSWEKVNKKLPMGIVSVPPERLNRYIPSLRLNMSAFVIHVDEGTRLRPIENLMYHRTFKGAIDFVARYGYYHLVRWITRFLARGDTTPNCYTIISILCVWAASPLFVCGQIVPGLVVAWLGVILDSVDGKLARLRLHLDQSMGKFEHIAAAPGLAFWFAAIGWNLSKGELLSSSSNVAIGTWILIILFIVDKVCSGVFSRVFGRELFDYQPFDARFHLIAARRNIALLIFSVGMLTDSLISSFWFLLIWMAFTVVIHTARFFWILYRRSII